MKTQKVMISGQDAVIRMLLGQYLQERGYSVAAVGNAAECLKELERGIPDVMVVDSSLPDMSAIDLLRSIRTNPNTSTIPVVMLSSDNEIETPTVTATTGADKYIRRTSGVKDIGQSIEKMLGRHQP